MRKVFSLTRLLRHCILLCACVICLCVSGRAQSFPSKNSTDTTGVRKIFTAARQYEDADSAVRVYKMVLQKAIAIHDTELIKETLFVLGEKNAPKGDWAQAIYYMKQARQYCASTDEVANYYDHMGWVYFMIGDYVTSSENFYTALDYIKKAGIITANESGAYRFLGLINSRLDQNEKALNYFNLSESLARKNHYENYVVLALISKGEFYTALHRPDSAWKCYNEAINLSHKIKRFDLTATANEGIGKTLVEAGAYSKAIPYLQSAIRIAEKRDKDVVIDASFYLGEAMYRLKIYATAQDVLVPALKLTSSTNLKDNAIKGYKTLMEVYKATGQYTRALDCMDSIIVLKDSLVNAQKVKAINVMEMKYKTAEKDKKIALQDSKLARKNTLLLGIAAFIIIFLLVAAWVYYVTVNKQRSVEKENRIKLLNATIAGGDSERGRIARELHDGVGGMLSAAMMSFSSMHRGNAAITAMPAYNDAMNILREMGDEIRKTAHNLMPEVLLKQSLPEAVGAYCNNVAKNGSLEIDFQYYGSFSDVTEHYKLNLYRIVQELVRNVIQHSRATVAMVQLMRTEKALILSIEDNGEGFNIDQEKGGQGLHNAQMRVKNLGGNFTIGSMPGNGTSVFIELNTAAVAKPEAA